MTKVLHDIEKRIIKAIKDDESVGRPPYPKNSLKDTTTLYTTLGTMTGLSLDQVRRGIEWLRLKRLIRVDLESTNAFCMARNGQESLENKLPERRLMNLLNSKSPRNLPDLQRDLGPLLGPAMGIAKKNGWITVSGGSVSLREYPGELLAEKALERFRDPAAQATENDARQGRIGLSEDKFKPGELASLDRPGFLDVTKVVKRSVSLLDSVQSIDLSDSDGIDVAAGVPNLVVARRHPLKDVIDEIREIFVTLGFTEISGNMTQSSFWNFDALFTPQDHPAREMQDTFYLDSAVAATRDVASDLQMRRVSESHRRNWRYRWDAEQARRMVLRTHTTCVTIRHLAEHRPEEARFFSLGRVFRNEKVSYKHLVEFNQIEGVVTGRNATLRDLMGIQKEFYRRIGITKVKFWPTFFPYTEPSLQTMVYNEKLGKWVELFGMGIFRREVTKPLGIDRPVLAWGGGIERIAMLRYDLDDVREFYNNNLDWLRNAVKCQ